MRYDLGNVDYDDNFYISVSVVVASMIFIPDFPMPPTSNHLYATILRGGKALRVPSKTYTQFKKNVKQWQLMNLDKVQEAHTTLERLDEEERVLSVERYFLFHQKSLYRKDGYPKKMDTSNRVKALDDMLFEILEIDDKLIWRGSEEKIEIPDNQLERTAIIIHPTREKKFNQLEAFTLF